jgi:hypothetical protein
MLNGSGPGGAPVLTVKDLRWVGSGLHRPESVLCTASGDVWCADWRGGVARIAADGTQSLLTGGLAPGEAPLRPNGIALLPDGSFLLADISDERAGVWRLLPSGEVEPFLLRVDGAPLPPVNFVAVDGRGRVWVTVSTRLQPRARDYRPDARSGFVVLVDARGARVVADGLGYSNECRLDAAEEHLYLNETFARRLSRFRIAANGSLGDRETVATFGPGTFPDGLANPTAMFLSAAMMLEWLAERHGSEACASAAERLERAVESAFAGGRLRTAEYGGADGTAAVTRAVMAELAR